jgi:hypothetical protein
MDVCPYPSMLCCPVRNQCNWKNRQIEKGKERNKEKKRKEVAKA